MAVRNRLYCGDCWETKESEADFTPNMRRCRECQRVYNQYRSWIRRGCPPPRKPKTLKHRRARKAHYQNLRRANQMRAMPAWANLEAIAAIYASAKPGEHVDHIVPLAGRNVCGLHVENNLHVILARDNIKKSNRWGAEIGDIVDVLESLGVNLKHFRK